MTEDIGMLVLLVFGLLVVNCIISGDDNAEEEEASRGNTD